MKETLHDPPNQEFLVATELDKSMKTSKKVLIQIRTNHYSMLAYEKRCREESTSELGELQYNEIGPTLYSRTFMHLS